MLSMCLEKGGFTSIVLRYKIAIAYQKIKTQNKHKMANSMKQHLQKSFQHVNRAALLLMVGVLLTGVLVGNRLVEANSLEDQIRVLQEENRNNRSAVASLMDTAASYQDAIDKLQSQIDQLQTQINEQESQKVELERQIEIQQEELGKQKLVLGENIKAMYVDDNMSTIEMLATSKDLGEFVDKETYRNAVQRKIQETMAKITALQNELNAKKQQVEVLLESLQTQRATVNASRAEQSRLLAMNQQQQAEFNNKTKANQSKIADLNRQIAAQRAANNSGIIPDGGYYFIRVPGSVGNFNPDDYPFKNAGFSMQLSPCSFYDGYPDSPDGWGYCTRQCTSFAAWAVGASGRSIPMYYGNAKNWVNKAPSSQIYRSPEVGDIAVSTAGTWGHVMYVADVSGGKFLAWEYNKNLDGRLSTTRWISWR